MRLLFDTHALIWWLLDDLALGADAPAAIASGDDDVFASAASAFEIAIKFRLGKLPQAALLARQFERVVADEDFKILAICARHGRTAGGLDIAHKDPFDRLLIAQALTEDMLLVSNQRLFDSYGVNRLW